MMAMTATALRNAALLDSGTPSPNPWDLTLSRQNVWSKLEGTRTEDRAPQGCDPSADSRAGMAGAAPMPGPSQTQLRPRRKQSLLTARNGLDKGVHFRSIFQRPLLVLLQSAPHESSEETLRSTSRSPGYSASCR